MEERFYELNVAGLTRKLRIQNISDSVAIAGFLLLGDVELVVKCAALLKEKVPVDTEVILTAESKGIPLAAELARQMGLPRYAVARKSVKAYMHNPIWVEDESITTKGKQRLYLMEDDVKLLQGKRTLLLDDVISTGGSLLALEKLSDMVQAKIVGKATVLAEGDAAKRRDIIFLEKLPLFDGEGNPV